MKREKPETIVLRIERYLRHAWIPSWKIVGPWLQDYLAAIERDIKPDEDINITLFPILLKKFRAKHIINEVCRLPDSEFRNRVLDSLMGTLEVNRHFPSRLMKKCGLKILSSAFLRPQDIKACLRLYCKPLHRKSLNKIEEMIPHNPKECLDVLSLFLHLSDLIESYSNSRDENLALLLFRQAAGKMTLEELKYATWREINRNIGFSLAHELEQVLIARTGRQFETLH